MRCLPSYSNGPNLIWPKCLHPRRPFLKRAQSDASRFLCVREIKYEMSDEETNTDFLFPSIGFYKEAIYIVAILDSNLCLNSTVQVFNVAILDSKGLREATLDSNVAILDSKIII